MTGIELAIIAISAAGLLISMSIGINIGFSFPERSAAFGNRMNHSFRKKIWKKNKLITLSASKIPFAAVCEYISTCLRENTNSTADVNSSGEQYVTMNFYDVIFNFSIPETDSDIRLEAGKILIRVSGEQNGPANAFFIYYDDVNIYNTFTKKAIEPFIQKLETIKLRKECDISSVYGATGNDIPKEALSEIINDDQYDVFE